MDLTIYDILKGPVISEKAHRLNKKFKQLLFIVHQDANKQLIEIAFEKIFNVKVKNVRIQNRKGKTRVVRRRKHSRPDQKRAIITLAEGYSLNLFEQVSPQESNDATQTTVQ